MSAACLFKKIGATKHFIIVYKSVLSVFTQEKIDVGYVKRTSNHAPTVTQSLPLLYNTIQYNFILLR